MATGISHILMTILLILSYIEIILPSGFDFGVEFLDFDEYVSEAPSSSGGSKKRSRNYDGAPSSTKRKRAAYIGFSVPLQQDVIAVNNEFLRSLEEDLSHSGYEYPWDLANLPVERGKYLCIEYFQKYPMKNVTITEDMNADCDILLTSGPTIKKTGLIKYYGYFKHYESTNALEFDFFGDLLKCYCAYNKLNKNALLKTVQNTKKNFFLLKRTETLYYVLTTFGDPLNRNVMVIDILEVLE